MEEFDVYNSKGIKTGLVLNNGQELKEGQYKMAVNTWFIDDNKLLIQKRSSKLRTGAGKWSATSGGSILGETPEDTAIRECYEELGVSILKDELIQIGKVFDKNYMIYVFVIHKKIGLNEITLQKNEVQDVSWKPLKDIETLISSGEFFGNMRAWLNVSIYMKFWNKILKTH